MDRTEPVLEHFRDQWRTEVSAKATAQRSPGRPGPGISSPSNTVSLNTVASVNTCCAGKKPVGSLSKHKHITDGSMGWGVHEPRLCFELASNIPPPGNLVRSRSGTSDGVEKTSPTTVLEHFGKAVEKEAKANLGESVTLYRKAFKLDDHVHENYKSQNLPPSIISSHSQPSWAVEPAKAKSTNTNETISKLPTTLSELISAFSHTQIQAEIPPAELSPPMPCAVARLPDELLLEVLAYVAIFDVASYARLALVCRRLAYLTMTEDRIWRRLVLGMEVGFGAMVYCFKRKVNGQSFSTGIEYEQPGRGLSPTICIARKPLLPLSPIYPTYLQMFKLRPRIRFSGCYISTVNYSRPGTIGSHITWNTSMLIVTYFRYLRFFRDGSVISLLTTTAPIDVVQHLNFEQLRHFQEQPRSSLPGACMKDGLSGRWRLSGDPFEIHDSEGTAELHSKEGEGEVHIETEGVVPKYMYKMQLAISSAGKCSRNNKLTWKGYWSFNRVTDDWVEFGLKNDHAFYWSRVRSYGTGL